MHVAREERKGGGVGLLYKSNFTTKIDTPGQFSSFESLHVQVTSTSCSFRLVIIYRSGNDKEGRRSPFKVFVDEFGSLMDHYLLHPSKILITGDFNIWMDEPADTNAHIFNSLLTAYNMTQHVTSATHRIGHILDSCS